MVEKVLDAYGLTGGSVEPLGNGLINRTWKVAAHEGQYVLQRVNENVFRQPQNIAFNLKSIESHLAEHHPAYLFTKPLASVRGEEMICVDGAYYRVFLFVRDSHTLDVVEKPEQAYEAAAQFGKFTRLLSRFDAARLKTTIPHFHDLRLRYHQFLLALQNGNSGRIAGAATFIKALNDQADIVTQYDRISADPAFKLRVTHHDTKISNVLFDKNGKGLCVIDLDTVMPGYFISDVGDMMRTYLSPVSEEERDFSTIEVRDEFYQAIVQGYDSQMKAVMTRAEKEHFFYAGRFMIYMQALRFLTDHLNNDAYYGAKYAGQNFVRAGNQLALLEQLMKKRKRLESITVL